MIGLRLKFLLCCCAFLVLYACKLVESEPEWDNPADMHGDAYQPPSSSSVRETSSSSASSSSRAESSSSSEVVSGYCAFDDAAYINRACVFRADQFVTGSVVLGPRAVLRFVGGTRLMVMGGTLEAEPGAELAFDAGGYVHVSSGGRLLVRGNALNPVQFRADSAGVVWGVAGDMVSSAGIFVDNTAAEAVFEYARVSGARVGVYVAGPGLTSFTGCEFTGNAKYGLALNAPQQAASLRSSSFHDNGSADMWVSLPALSGLHSDLSFDKGIAYSRNDLSENLSMPGYPYIAQGTITLNENVQMAVAAGASFRFAPGAFINVAEGQLRINGTELLPVVLAPLSSSDFWGDQSMPAGEYQTGIHFNQGCMAGSRLESVRIIHARTAVSNWCSQSVELRNSELLDYMYYAFSGSPSSFNITGTSRVSSSIPGSQMYFTD